MSGKRLFWVTFGSHKPESVSVSSDGFVHGLKKSVKAELHPRLENIDLDDWNLHSLEGDDYSDVKIPVTTVKEELKVVISGVLFSFG